MPALKMIWFDFGGVLSPPIVDLFKQYERKTGLEPEVLQQAMKDVADDMNVPMLAPLENALLSEYEWGQRLTAALRKRYPKIDLSSAQLTKFGEQWFNGVKANSVMISAVYRLKAAGYMVGILTNNVLEWEPFWRQMVGLDGVVDHIVDSCKEGCRKPDERFFTLACQRTGVEPAHSLLIDDVEENIESAAGMGWQTLHFINNFDVLSILEQKTGVILQSLLDVTAE